MKNVLIATCIMALLLFLIFNIFFYNLLISKMIMGLCVLIATISSLLTIYFYD